MQNQDGHDAHLNMPFSAGVVAAQVQPDGLGPQRKKRAVYRAGQGRTVGFNEGIARLRVLQRSAPSVRHLALFDNIWIYIWHKVGWCIAACDLHVHVWPFSFPSQSLKESAFVSWYLGRNERARFLASFCRMDLPDIYIYLHHPSG